MSSVPSLAGPGQSLQPLAVPGGAQPPLWLDQLMERLDANPQVFARFEPPDEGGRESSVLLLFGPDPHGADSILLIERAHDSRSHPGHVAFPGGGVEPGDTGPVDTALREAAEEVNLEPTGVQVVGTIAPIYFAVSDFLVTPVIGWWRDAAPVSPGDPAEVAQVILAPLEYLVDPANRYTVRHPTGFFGPAFPITDDILLWGFTGGIITSLLELAGLARPWDDTRTIPLPERLIRGRR